MRLEAFKPELPVRHRHHNGVHATDTEARTRSLGALQSRMAIAELVDRNAGLALP